jgi:guanine deaminase
MAITGIRGTFFDFVDDPWKHVGSEHEAARFTLDGLLVIDDGIIVAFGDADDVAGSYTGLDPTVIPDRIIMPGFVDGHIHVPQTRVLGAFGQQLLPWLNDTVFPEEAKYADREYAPEGTTSTPEQFYADSTAMIEKYHGTGRNLYAITPRFALGATEQLLEACQKLKQEHPDLWVNTHISENPAEIAGVLRAHPDCTDYLGVYEKYGLVGPKFSGGHGIWLSDNEFARMSDSGAAVVFCPCSNLFLGSGVFRLGKATDPDRRVRMSFGTDMGGGNRFSMVDVLDEAYKVGMLGNTMLDGSTNRVTQDLAQSERSKLSPYRAFWSVTLGGAEGLHLDDRIGNFEVGKEADFVALDYTAGPPAMAWHQELFFDSSGPSTMEEAAHALFSIMMVGDERNVDETWVSGVRLYKKA